MNTHSVLKAIVVTAMVCSAPAWADNLAARKNAVPVDQFSVSVPTSLDVNRMPATAAGPESTRLVTGRSFSEPYWVTRIPHTVGGYTAHDLSSNYGSDNKYNLFDAAQH